MYIFISYFFYEANATPMLQTLVNSTTEFIQNSAIPNVSSAAETFAAVSYVGRLKFSHIHYIFVPIDLPKYGRKGI